MVAKHGPGSRLARGYELKEIAGEGGMATVWRAFMHGAEGFSRMVAIKQIRPEFGSLQTYVDMFVEEARMTADLLHPNVVQVFDFFKDQGSLFMVMEWVEGIDLGGFINSYRRHKHNVPWPLAVAIGIESLRGLGAAHSRCRADDGTSAPVVHRDVSPTNILLATNGTVKLTDFGLARARDRLFSLTLPGTVKGKLNYLAPEIANGQQATPRSDIFSMSTVLWEVLVGRQLFAGINDAAIFKKLRSCNVPSICSERPDVPPRLDSAIRKGLAIHPQDRFQTAEEMMAEFVEILVHEYNPWKMALELAAEVVRIQREPDEYPNDPWSTPPSQPPRTVAPVPSRLSTEEDTQSHTPQHLLASGLSNHSDHLHLLPGGLHAGRAAEPWPAERTGVREPAHVAGGGVVEDGEFPDSDVATLPDFYLTQDFADPGHHHHPMPAAAESKPQPDPRSSTLEERKKMRRDRIDSGGGEAPRPSAPVRRMRLPLMSEDVQQEEDPTQPQMLPLSAIMSAVYGPSSKKKSNDGK